ncbi:MAG: histidine kinase [Bacteroidales bacterium]
MISLPPKKLIPLLSSPFLLAAIPSLILFLLVPVKHERYILELKSSTQVLEGYWHSYCDLNGDGTSERIVAFDNVNSSGITISRGNSILNQWNVQGSFSFSNRNTLYIPADCNADGVKEIYLFSMAGDSILLHSIPNPDVSGFALTNRMIDVAGPGIKAPDPLILTAEPEDLDGDGFPELIFGISSGFSKHPRKVYAYNTVTDSLVASPDCGGFLLGIIQHDIDSDGFREIMPYGYAAENIPEDEMQYHDQSAWLTVLDRNLRFIFDPVELGGSFTMAKPMVLQANGNTVTDLLVSSVEADSTAVLWSFGINGTITGRTPVEASPYNSLMTVNRRNEPIYALLERDRGIVVLDKQKRIRRVIDFIGSPNVTTRDIDRDGSQEIIIFSIGTGRVYVYRAGFSKPATADIGWDYKNEPVISIIYKQDEWPEIFLQSGTRQALLEYRPNPLYYASFAFYPLIYGAFIAFVLLIQYTQKRALLRREEERKKISELQLALIRNQLDPHFTLNALNSVLHLVEQSDKEKVRDSLLRFSGLYRELLLSAGKSRRTLGEELGFCREYLALEKMRFGNRFNYVIDMPEGINDELLVPKLVIQLFAENSVKHGLAGLGEGGHLAIKVRGSGNELTIEVKDNGIGRTRAAEEQSGSTGRGMKLMNELFELCNRYYEDTYSFNVSDLADGSGQPAGTLVTIAIHYRNEAVCII